MTHLEEHIDIAAPPSTVFSFCRDIEKRPTWDERVVRIELLSDKPIRQGTLIQIDGGYGGNFAYSWEGEFSSLQFPSGFTIRVLDASLSSPFKSGSENWQFNALGGVTRVTLTWDYKPRNFFATISDVLMRRALTRRDMKRSLANLKKALEIG